MIGIACVFSAWLTITSVGYLGSQSLLSDSHARIRTLQQAYADLSFEAEVQTTAFLEQIDDLEARGEQQEAAIAELTKIKADLQRQLEAHTRQLVGVSEERNRARLLVDGMQQAVVGAEYLLGAVADERSALRRRLKAAEDQLAEVRSQRDASRRAEVGLRWQLAYL